MLSSRIHPWAGIHMGPLHSMHQAWHTGLLWGAKQGPKDSAKYQLSSKYINAVFTMYFLCRPDVLSMYFEGIGCEVTENFNVLVEYQGCINLLCPGLSSRLSAWSLESPWGEVPEKMYWGCIGQCIRNVSWVYYECNNHVSLMYYGCIGICALHLNDCNTSQYIIEVLGCITRCTSIVLYSQMYWDVFGEHE
jgi:hypothetical protein